MLLYLKYALNKFKEKVILIEDGAPVYQGYIKGIRKLIQILTFFLKWLALLLDLNAIKKV